MSAMSCLTTLSATSALAPLNFAPRLSCVVDQIDIAIELTSRTAAMASCLRSMIFSDSSSPTPTLAAARLLVLNGWFPFHR